MYYGSIMSPAHHVSRLWHESICDGHRTDGSWTYWFKPHTQGKTRESCPDFTLSYTKPFFFICFCWTRNNSTPVQTKHCWIICKAMCNASLWHMLPSKRVSKSHAPWPSALLNFETFFTCTNGLLYDHKTSILEITFASELGYKVIGFIRKGEEERQGNIMKVSG